jgi:hypothetical protein
MLHCMALALKFASTKKDGVLMNTSLTSPSLLRDFYYPCACTTNSIKLAHAGAIADCLRISIALSSPCSRFNVTLQLLRRRLAVASQSPCPPLSPAIVIIVTAVAAQQGQ